MTLLWRKTWILSLGLLYLMVVTNMHVVFAESSPILLPGSVLTFAFPDMPRTFADLMTNNHIVPKMAVFLPKNFDLQRTYPLFVLLGGGSGSTGANPGVARAITEEMDFVSVDLPFFKIDTKDIVIRDDDCRLMWPLYKRMLTKLTETIPNIDPAHRILGGFSNGAHATGGLIDNSDGEVARWFSGFIFIEGGGRTRRYDLISGKPLLFMNGGLNSIQARNRAKEIATEAANGGVKVTAHEMEDAGHAFPSSQYATVRQWLREVALH